MSELRFYSLHDIAMLSRFSTISRLMNSIPVEGELESFQHFKDNYYHNANFIEHQAYSRNLLSYKTRYGRYPSRRDFYLSFRNTCMCEYSMELDNNEFVNACEFFMKQLGDIISNQCERCHFFKEFSLLEHRAPNDMDEFNHYLLAVIMSSRHPEVFFNTPVVTKPISTSKVDELKQTIRVIENASCGICQDDIHDQDAVKLDCGHFFHATEKDCCENGTIFNWLKENRVCPICRHELL